MQVMKILNRERQRLLSALDYTLNNLAFRNNVVKEYFILAANDIIGGASLGELHHSLNLFEELEDYDECEGILLACEWSTLISFTNYLTKNYEPHIYFRES